MFNTQLRVLLPEFCNAGWNKKKTRMMAGTIPCDEKSLICTTVLTQYWH